MKEHIHFKTRVPNIKEIAVHLIVADNIRESHETLKVIYDDYCARNGGESHMEDKAFDVYIFIDKIHLTYGIIGHEIHHTFNHICNRIGHNPDCKNDELDARVHEFLHGWVYEKVIQSKLTIGTTRT